MTLLIVGLVLWSGLHFVPSLAIPLRRQLIEKLGEKQYAIMFSVLVVASIALMVLGWRSTLPVHIYTPPAWGGPVTGLLMLVAFVLFSAAHSESSIRRVIRHSQLTGLVIWSIGHLLSNGDNRSLVLFGALGVWAIAEITLINRREGDWVKPAPGTFKSELLMVVKGLVIFAVLLFAHPYLFGVSPIVR